MHYGVSRLEGWSSANSRALISTKRFMARNGTPVGHSPSLCSSTSSGTWRQASSAASESAVSRVEARTRGIKPGYSPAEASTRALSPRSQRPQAIQLENASNIGLSSRPTTSSRSGAYAARNRSSPRARVKARRSNVDTNAHDKSHQAASLPSTPRCALQPPGCAREEPAPSARNTRRGTRERYGSRLRCYARPQL